MNRVIRVICMLLIWQNIQAQNNIKNWEYWFDNDYESLVREPLNPSEILTIDKEIPVSGLSFGLHTLNFRFEDETNGWSPALSRFFSYYTNSGIPVIRQVTQLQYWYNENIGQVNTIDIPATANLNLDELIDVSALNEGLHTLNYRFSDKMGGWSPALSRFFSYYTNSGAPVIHQLTQLQYWFDENFEQVVTTDIPVNSNHNLDELIDVSALNEGLHTVNYRFKDESGGWSPALSKFFSHYPNSGVPELRPIVQVEYWFNQDYSTVVTKNISESESFELDELIDVESLTNGLYIISYRFKDKGNCWSPAVSKFFSKFDLQEVVYDNQTVAYRYWVDDNTSTITSMEVPVPFKSILIDELIDVYEYPSGEHFLNIQFKDKLGKWSAAISDTVILELNPSAKLSASATAACMNGEISFFADTVDVTSILWDFGDGKSSVAVNPVHSYDVAGKYEVSAVVGHIGSARVKTVKLTDSIEVFPVYTENVNTSVCSVELPFVFGSQSLTETGIYNETFNTVIGCDSLVTLNLTVNQSYNTSVNITVCETELPYTFGNHSITGPGIYTETFSLVTGCDSVVTLNLKVRDCSRVCTTLHFKQGWNIFSVSNTPDSTGVMAICQPLVDKGSLVKVQDELGNSLEDWGIFGGWTNNIGEIDLAEGYKIKVSIADSLEICGIPVQYPFAIPLRSGWNIIGYPKTVSTDGMINVVQQLINRGSLTKVQDELGNSIEDWGIFGGWTNNIGEFVPGEGYKIKVNAKDTLWIYENYPKSSVVQPENRKTAYFKAEYSGNGIDHMNINLIGLPVNILKAGDEFAVFDGKTCVGAVTLMPYHLRNQSVSITASATDNQGMAGFAEGNQFTLKLWNSQNNQEFVLEPEIIKGTSTFTKHETTIASLEKYATTGWEKRPGSNCSKINVYPNPFSDELNIEIFIPGNEKIVLEIYDTLGRTVKKLYTGNHGDKFTLTWNGKNENGDKVVSGIYFLRANEFSVKIVRK